MRILRRAFRFLLIVVAVFVVWSLFRASTPATAFRREIVVNVPRDVAWDHFSRPKQWSSWLGDGAPTAISPSDVVGPDTVATFADAFTFRMTEFAPYDHWMWSAKAGWLTMDYDHRFDALSERQTRMVFHQTVTGFGNDLLATVIGVGTRLAGHPAMLQRLADEMNRLPAASN